MDAISFVLKLIGSIILGAIGLAAFCILFIFIGKIFSFIEKKIALHFNLRNSEEEEFSND